MKLRVLLVPLLFATLAACQRSDADVVAEAHAHLVTGCQSSGDQQMPGVAKEKIEAFCRCSADKVTAELGAEGVRRLEAAGEMTEEVTVMTQQAALACIQQLAP